MTNPEPYGEFQHIDVERDPNGVLHLTLNRPEVLNAANARLHWELGEIWRVFDRDPDARVALVTGAGRAFSAGGDLAMVEAANSDIGLVKREYLYGRSLVENMIATDKPIISAINGAAVGAGLAVALLADISIVAETAKLSDGHLRLGVVAGDHAAMLWPLLCGIAKAKYYLMTAEFVTGAEAERIGLVSRCVPDADVVSTASELAQRLASGPQSALQWTKRSINQWLASAAPIFNNALALEMLTLMDADVKEGIRSLRERTAPDWPSGQADGRKTSADNSNPATT